MSKRRGSTFWEKFRARLVDSLRAGIATGIESIGYRHLETQFRLDHVAPEITTSETAYPLLRTYDRNADRSYCRNKATCRFHGPDADDYLASHAREFQTRWLQEHIALTSGETE